MRKLNLMFMLLVVVSLITLHSCKEEEITSNKEAKTIITKEGVSNRKPVGRILNSKGTPIDRATVKLKDRIIGVSDAEGYVYFNEDVLKSEGVLKIEHQDYVTSVKNIDKNDAFVYFLSKRGESQFFEAREGGKFVFEDNIMMSISPNSFNLNGKPFYGKVELKASHIDVANLDDLQSAPASFIAQDSQGGNLYPLTSFGMVEVRASVAGENIPLDLNEGTVIDIALPITVEETPDTTNLYVLDELTGYWSLEGKFVRNGNQLLGQITSVNSSWNADDPCASQLVCVRIKMENQDGTPFNSCNVIAQGLTYNGTDGHKVPDANGYVEFNVCPNSVFKVLACLIIGNPGGACSIGSSPYVYCTTIDLSTVALNPNGCTDLGTWVVN